MTDNKQLNNLIVKYQEKVKEYREHIHRHPELSACEEKTGEYIAEILRGMGLEVKTHVGGFGVTAVLNGRGPGRCIALRSDMDALPVKEATGLPFSSENEGVAHVCGHDSHMAMLLGAAHILNELNTEFDGCVKFIFQPSEEMAANPGAPRMVRDGALCDPKPELIVGQHVWPAYPVGQAAVRCGAMMAASDRFLITVHGKGSHGAEPQNGIDAVYIAGQIVAALQSILSRNLDPQDACVITIGSIHGGSSYNVVAEEVVMEGTVRTLDPAVHAGIPERIRKIASGIAESFGGSAELDYTWGVEAVINKQPEFEFLSGVITEVLGEEGLKVPVRSSMISEDFSVYGESVPAAFYWLGCRNPEKALVNLHNPGFYPEEETLPIGIRLFVTSALRFLQ